jgi:hypothetical protein
MAKFFIVALYRHAGQRLACADRRHLDTAGDTGARAMAISGLWAIGTFVGISLLFHGITWTRFALSLREIQ